MPRRGDLETLTWATREAPLRQAQGPAALGGAHRQLPVARRARRPARAAQARGDRRGARALARRAAAAAAVSSSRDGRAARQRRAPRARQEVAPGRGRLASRLSPADRGLWVAGGRDRGLRMILIPSTPEKLLANAAMMDRIRETARARGIPWPSLEAEARELDARMRSKAAKPWRDAMGYTDAD